MLPEDSMNAHRRFLGAGVACLLLASCATTTPVHDNVATDCTTPLPEDSGVAAPSEGVPSAYAKFLGTWGDGKWDDRLCHVLVVTEINADGSVTAIYSHGSYPDWGIDAPAWHEADGTIKDGRLVLDQFPNGAQAIYEHDGDTMRGTYHNTGVLSRIVLKRQ